MINLVVSVNIKNKISFLLKSLKEKLSAKNYSTHEKAFGAALGIFVGLLPVSPFQLVLLAGIIPFVKCYRAIAFITVWVANPITYVFIYAGEFAIGSFFVKSARNIDIDFTHLTIRSLKKLAVDNGFGIIFAILIGGVILSSISGIITYLVTKFILRSKDMEFET
ncbi:DUF2062 domain-containing protein [bacterium]|nr:DUF2062 domain-containing protein [bacterium]